MKKANSSKRVFLAAAALAGAIFAGGGVLAATAGAAPAKVDREAARDLFHSYSCSACHALADAGAGGSIGPALDNPKLSRDFVFDRIANGQGAMPGFGGQLSEADIGLLTDYIVEVSHETH